MTINDISDIVSIELPKVIDLEGDEVEIEIDNPCDKCFEIIKES